MLTVTYAECLIKAPYAECRGAALLALATFARASRICQVGRGGHGKSATTLSIMVLVLLC
jgi:hypothetical protein